MKWFSIIGLMVFSSLGFAASAAGLPLSEQPAFCQLDPSVSENVDADALFDTETITVREVSELSAFNLALVNDYLIQQQMADHALSLAEIQALFSPEGEESSNDLYILTRRAKSNGEISIEVRSYPGDNPVGTIYDASGKHIGDNGDDSYSFIDASGASQWCGN